MNPQLIAAAVFAVLCFASGWLVEGWRQGGEIARIERAYAWQRGSELQQHIDDLAEAERVGKALVARNAEVENALTLALQEKTDVVRRLTVGRPCLAGAVVRVLNQPAGLKPASVPETASQPDPAAAAFATDTDVGLWIGQCQRSYDTCRGRIEAINDFYKEVTE